MSEDNAVQFRAYSRSCTGAPLVSRCDSTISLTIKGFGPVVLPGNGVPFSPEIGLARLKAI